MLYFEMSDDVRLAARVSNLNVHRDAAKDSSYDFTLEVGIITRWVEELGWTHTDNVYVAFNYHKNCVTISDSYDYTSRLVGHNEVYEVVFQRGKKPSYICIPNKLWDDLGVSEELLLVNTKLYSGGYLEVTKKIEYIRNKK